MTEHTLTRHAAVSVLNRAALAITALMALAALLFSWQVLATPTGRAGLLEHGARGIGSCLLLSAAHLAFVFVFRRFLARSCPGLGRGWPDRLAFLGGSSLAIGLFFITGSGVPEDLGPRLAAALTGSFLGGLLATAVAEGLWENNFPPSTSVADDVYAFHQPYMSAPVVEPRGKRLFDLSLATLGLLFSAPLGLVSIFLIWFEDPGPVFFIKNSVGQGGSNFRQIKFRSMIRDAEAGSGPVPVSRDDQRVLLIGRFLRKSALDELPQLINVFRGEMSFVGPRPLRTVVIHEYLKELPHFAERHRVRPGIAGLSQVMGGYYLTPLQRLRFDRLYIRRMSLLLDAQILAHAMFIVIWLRWGKELQRRSPRW